MSRSREIRRIRRALLDGGALGAAMSGSGPTVFGLFADASRAERTAADLRARYAQTYLAQPVETMV